MTNADINRNNTAVFRSSNPDLNQDEMFISKTDNNNEYFEYGNVLMEFDDSRLGARFSFPTTYHPIHNDFSKTSEPRPALDRADALPGLKFATILEEAYVLNKEKNLFFVVSQESKAEQVSTEKDVLDGGLRIPVFSDILFVTSREAKPAAGEITSLIAQLAQYANCGPVSGIVITPKGAKKVVSLLKVIEEEPAKQLSRYFGLNLRTYCLNTSDQGQPRYVGYKDDRVEFEPGLIFDSEVITHVLNLDRSKQRLAEIERELSNANVTFMRFSAIDGKSSKFDPAYLIAQGVFSGWFDPNMPYHPLHMSGRGFDLRKDVLFGVNPTLEDVKYGCLGLPNERECINTFLGVGTMATGLSHRNMYAAHAQNFPGYHGLFFEDDVKIPADFKSKLSIALAEVPIDWDIIYLDRVDEACVARDVSKYLAQYAPGKTCMPGGFAAIINKNSFQKVVALMTPLYEESDRQLMKYFGSALNAYWVKDSIVKVPLDSVSDRRQADLQRVSNTNSIYDTIRFDDKKRPPSEWNRNHVLFTAYLTSDQDPQRNITWPIDNYDSIKPWHKSVDWHRLRGVVFHDNLSDEFIERYETSNIEFVKVKRHPRHGTHTYRFLLVLDYLESHPEIEYAYLTDGSDVVVRRNPFSGIQSDILYVGSEPESINATWDWLKGQAEPLFNYEKEEINAFRRAHGNKKLLNTGAVGGHRNIFIEFLREFGKSCERSSTARETIIDMAVFNKVLYSEQFASRFKTGHPVHSTFRGFEIQREDVFFVHK